MAIRSPSVYLDRITLCVIPLETGNPSFFRACRGRDSSMRTPAKRSRWGYRGKSARNFPLGRINTCPNILTRAPVQTGYPFRRRRASAHTRQRSHYFQGNRSALTLYPL